MEELEICPHPSLWLELKTKLRPPEVETARRIIGDKLIQEAEVPFAQCFQGHSATQDLHKEAEALAEILRDYREHASSRVAEVEYERRLLSNPQRMLVQSEMQSFVETLRRVRRVGQIVSAYSICPARRERFFSLKFFEGGATFWVQLST